MCGILCYVGNDAASRRERMLYALSTTAHRGPDHTGAELVADRVILGHNRLSIMDLSDAALQPMSLTDRGMWIVFNGEIYNFVELREELRARGHEFVSTGDTEVILHAYLEWGRGCTSRFNGMWAFALWDDARGELFCSRDRFGVKPFYFAHNAHRFVAASEVKGLLALEPDLARPDHGSIYHFVSRGLLDDTDHTFFSDIRQLPAGHSAVLNSDGHLAIERYYDPQDAVMTVRDGVVAREAAERLRALFEDSVRLRLRSDVPVGTCLSGGIDSSAIVGVASDLLGTRVSSFTSIYPHTDCDESGFARDVVERFNTVAHWIEPRQADFFTILPRLVYHQDEPSSAPGLYSQWHVMQLAQGNVRVLLDGQGGDEILAGYLGYYSDYMAALVHRAIRGDAGALSRLRREHGEISAQLGRNPFVAAALTRMPNAARRLSRALRHSRLLSADFAREWSAEEPLPHRPSGLGDPLNSQLLYSLTRATIPSLLHYEDRNSMAFSIEARTPFLDYRLVEYALALPPELKIRGWETKAVFRDAMRDLLPPSVLARRDKKGYPTPVALWLRQGLMPQVRDVLLSPEARARGILSIGEVARILDEHEAGRADHHQRIWSLLTLEVWFRTFIDGDDVLPVVI